ncbi:tyrosine-type recombinase/integrase [Streptomyces anulatus]
MRDEEEAVRDPARLVIPLAGELRDTGSESEPYQLIDPDGVVVVEAALFFAELLACCKPATTLRSYGMDLLRWYRFLWALGISWNRATRAEARDFTRWFQVVDKPKKLHWRYERRGLTEAPVKSPKRPIPGTPNAITGKPTPGRKYAPRTIAHSETVLRTFYEFQRDEGAGPILNPFPQDRRHKPVRSNAHHNPMEPFRNEKRGRYRPSVPKQKPKRIPDELFNELFVRLKYNRDRALLAFWVSTGARSEELLTAQQKSASPGEQLVGVIRKGSRDYQRLPASPDAFVWLRLYQEELRRNGVPRGLCQPLWWTLRRPWRPFRYTAARAMFIRANALLGANWTLHDLRHTASYRMARDKDLPLTDVQWVLGHSLLSTTQIYLPASEEEMITNLLAHHAREQQRREKPVPAPPSPRYNPQSMNILFGGPQ